MTYLKEPTMTLEILDKLCRMGNGFLNSSERMMPTDALMTLNNPFQSSTMYL